MFTFLFKIILLLIKFYRRPVCLKREYIPITGIFREGHETLEKSGSMFDIDILNDISCKHFKATTFEYPPSTTVKVLENGSLE